MKRSILFLLLVIGLLAAACSTESELPVNDSGDQPVTQGACIETEPDCEDTVVVPEPLPPYDGTDQPVSQGACIETEPDCDDTVAEPLPLNDGEAVTPGMGAVAGDGLSVAEALASSLDGTLAVGGFLVVDADGARLCDVLAESYPPLCDGDWALTIEGLNVDEYPVEEAQGVRWTNELVVVFGTMVDGVLVVDQLSM